MRRARVVVLLLLAVPGAAGCAREDVELAAPVRPRAVVAGAPPDAAGRAAPQVPPVTPSRAAEVFERALCTCTSALFTGALAIDAFDSADGPYAVPQSGADVGVNEQLATLAAVDVRGALIAAGSGPLTITNGPRADRGRLAEQRGARDRRAPRSASGATCG